MAEYVTDEADIRWILFDYIIGNAALVPSLCYERPGQHAGHGLFLHSHFGFLCDGTDSLRYGDTLDNLWAVGHTFHDTDRWCGIYDHSYCDHGLYQAEDFLKPAVRDAEFHFGAADRRNRPDVQVYSSGNPSCGGNWGIAVVL